MGTIQIGNIPGALHARFKAACALDRVSQRQKIIELIQEYVRRERKKTTRTYKDVLPKEIRNASKWDEEKACYVTPDGRAWYYTDDPKKEGVVLCNEDGSRLLVAVWLEED